MITTKKQVDLFDIDRSDMYKYTNYNLNLERYDE